MSTSATAPARSARSGASLAFLIGSGVLWGAGGLLGRLLGRATGLAPLSVAAYRLVIGGVLILALLALARRPWPAGRAAWTRIVVVGLLAACFQGAYFVSIALTSVTLSTLVTIGSAPVIVLTVETLTGRVRASLRTTGITGLAVGGLALLVGLPSHGLSAGHELAGAALAVLAATAFGAMTLVGAKPVPGLDDVALTGAGFTVGGLALLPAAAASGTFTFQPHPAALALLAALVLGPTVVAYTLYFRGLRGVSAGTAALLTLVEPLAAGVLAAVVLGDRLGWAGLSGAGLLGVAVVLTVRAHQAGPGSGPASRTGAAERAAVTRLGR